MELTAKVKLAEIERRIVELGGLLDQEVDAAAQRPGDGAVHLRRAVVVQATINSLHDEVDALRRLVRKTAGH
ncbi:hypothetical protein ACIKT0_01635 [Hansschlegelia beijingensis]|uniref:hypothetical protein n=1 Tax=Hansschlegelia beijingensis TaxID=1133344 RepID=UPI00387F1FFE